MILLMMKAGAALALAVAMVVVMPGDDARACTNSCVSSNTQVRLVKAGVAISIAGWHGDHTWADAWVPGAWDVVNNFGGGNSSCASTSGSAGCSWAYSAWNMSWGGTECSSEAFLSCRYLWGDNLTYGITGVCHQSANRANATFGVVPWVKNAGGIGGSALSYAMFGNCGANLLGVPYSC
jgi:hypothetical protein